jgi:hypothetical protein
VLRAIDRPGQCCIDLERHVFIGFSPKADAVTHIRVSLHDVK